MNIEIDVEQFARDIKAGKSIGGKDGAILKSLTASDILALPIKNSLLKNSKKFIKL